jgi:tripartite-type tricarboxylate transporter receptor subunit TctC
MRDDLAAVRAVAKRSAILDRRDVLTGAGATVLNAPFFPVSAQAQQDYPSRPIRLIVPFAAGGLNDATARLWAEKVKGDLNANLFIDNRVGAGGTIGAGEAAHARGDGYTLFLGSSTTQVLNPTLMPKVPYDPLADFSAVSIFAVGTATIAVRPSVPARDLRELVAFIKARPGQLSYGSAGAGSDSHLAGEVFKHLGGGLDLTHIAYKGGSPALSDLVGGHIPIASLHMTPQLLALHRSGEIRVLAVTGPTRLAVAPDIPTGEEAGMPGLIATTFNGILAPAGTSAVIIERLDAATQKAMASADFAKALTDAGFEPLKGVGGAVAQRYIADELKRLVPVIKAINFKLG